ncbi:MAG: hypothetical protein JSW53_01890 [Candidatus Bathyarchaeota archaeon]|nr:MAG: hypothetical protein JSW53_01890 [Candidatus Bathyarchaeota archaeon]
MTDEDLIMVIDKPNFTIKLHQNLLEVDLKEGTKKKFESFVEENPMLRGSLGFLFQNVIPLDVALKDIESVEQDDKGQVKITIPHRKDINIPLEPNESKKLIAKLEELILVEKQKEIERILALDRRKLLRRLKTLSLERGESEKIAHRPAV